MSLQDYSPGELMPRHLSLEEITEPLRVITEFFQFQHLPQARELLWKLLKLMIVGNFGQEMTTSEREELVRFYEELNRLLEAVYILHGEEAFPAIKTGANRSNKNNRVK